MTGPEPDAAPTAAAVAIHDTDCPDRTRNGSAVGHCYRLAAVALESALPAIRSAEGERIRQPAIEHDAHVAVRRFEPFDVAGHAPYASEEPFADLLRREGEQ